MKRHSLFLTAAVFWLLLLSPASRMLAGFKGPDNLHSVLNVGLFFWIAGLLLIYFFWAKRDSIEHGRGTTTAAVFALLLLVLNLLAHFIYLFYTRGFKNGALASLYFFVFMVIIAGTSAALHRFGVLS